MMNLRSQIEEYVIDAVAMIAATAATISAISLNITLSSLVHTEWEALFISMAALTSLSLFNIERWRLPALFILLVAAFPAPKYLVLHYIWAALFFLTSYLKIATSKRYSWWALSVFPAVAILVVGKFTYVSLLWFEVVAITSIVAHHVCYLVKRIRVYNKKINR